jgi:hypothetical protein
MMKHRFGEPVKASFGDAADVLCNRNRSAYKPGAFGNAEAIVVSVTLSGANVTALNYNAMHTNGTVYTGALALPTTLSATYVRSFYSAHSATVISVLRQASGKQRGVYVVVASFDAAQQRIVAKLAVSTASLPANVATFSGLTVDDDTGNVLFVNETVLAQNFGTEHWVNVASLDVATGAIAAHTAVQYFQSGNHTAFLGSLFETPNSVPGARQYAQLRRAGSAVQIAEFTSKTTLNFSPPIELFAYGDDLALGYIDIGDVVSTSFYFGN